MRMPEPDQEIIRRRRRIADDLRAICPEPGAVIVDEEELRVWECDALAAYRQMPLVVVLPRSAAQVAGVLGYCYRAGVPVVARGAGTSLSGGALPVADGVLLALTRMDRILEVDWDNRCVVAQPGATNLAITRAVESRGFHYAPDPSSQIVCSIGGNVAENAGGVHCLKYGLTTNNLLGLEMVLADGGIVRLGGRQPDADGYDLMGVVAGSEGLLGIVTEVIVRILPKPDTARALLVGFADEDGAAEAVAAIIAAGIIPGGMEMMDAAAVRATESYCRAGYPLDAGALLIVELDGPEAEVDHLAAKVEALCRDKGATSVRASADEDERQRFWLGRKSAFPALAVLAPDYLCMDGTIPRRRLPEVLRRIRELAGMAGLAVVNVFHAGDGNLHPLILFDANKPGELANAESLGADILKLCVEVGGVLTGEHGVGVEKRDLMGTMFSEADLRAQNLLKCAFDEKGLLNPGKVLPTLHRCADMGWMRVSGGALPFPDVERF